MVILLDACRYDVFKQVHGQLGLKHPLIKAVSPASQTRDWYLRTFAEALKPEETVLVGGTVVPWSNHLRELHDRWYRKHAIWRNERGERDSTWSLWSRTTVTNLVKRGLQEAELHPDKTILVHCLPPHLPFYGKRGADWWRRTFGENIDYDQYLELRKYGKRNGWDDLREYYRESVEQSLREITKFVLPSGTVVTSDHGELTGENNQWIHSIEGGDYIPKLRNVPWMEVASI